MAGTKVMGVDVTDAFTNYGAAAAAGGIQRLAWGRSEGTGWMTTGGLILLGLFGSNFFQGQLGQVVRSASLGAAAGFGWIAAERLVVNKEPLFKGAEAKRLQGPRVHRPLVAGARAPQASILGVNPNTGEEILSSSVNG